MNIIDRQTFVISINCATFATSALGVEVKSQVSLPMNLRFAADEMILKNISYNSGTTQDVADVVQIWCNKTNDGLIGSFPNGGGGNKLPGFCQHNEHFRISNSFQTGTFVLQLQQTGSGGSFSTVASYSPQPLISSYPNGSQTTYIVSITLEFVK